MDSTSATTANNSAVTPSWLDAIGSGLTSIIQTASGAAQSVVAAQITGDGPTQTTSQPARPVSSPMAQWLGNPLMLVVIGAAVWLVVKKA